MMAMTILRPSVQPAPAHSDGYSFLYPHLSALRAAVIRRLGRQTYDGVSAWVFGRKSLRQRRAATASLDEEKLSDGIVISNEKLPAPVFVFANRVRCTPGVDDNGGAVGCGSIKLDYW
jgi:hypothetical protein